MENSNENVMSSQEEVNENTILINENVLQDAINEVFGADNSLTQLYDQDITHLFSPIPSPILRQWSQENRERDAARQPIMLSTSYTEIFPSAPPAKKRF